MNDKINSVMGDAEKIAKSLLDKPESNGKDFPFDDGVYLIYQKNKVIIYVGQGKCLFRRINDDHVSGEVKISTSSFRKTLSEKLGVLPGPDLRKWIVDNCSFACVIVENRDMRKLVESLLIYYLRDKEPLFNK